MEPFTESTEKITKTALPSEIKTACLELLSNSQGLLPEMSLSIRRRMPALIEHLVSEVTDPQTPVHTWELTLDLLILEAGKQSELGQPAVENAGRLRSLLRNFMGVYGPVSLEKISMETVGSVCLLSETLREPHSRMVAPNVYSLAQAHFNEHAWFRAIFAGKAPVGFMMIVDDDQTPEYFLWRFMIGEPFQGRGYGREAIARLVDYVRTRPGATELGVSCGEGEGSPEGFYRRLGFIPTGERLGDEIVLKLKL